MIKRKLSLWLGVLVLFCSTLSLAAPVGDIIVTEPRIRAMPPGSMNTAAYLSIKNVSTSDVKLVKATSPISDNVQLHDNIKKDGKMSMVHQMSVNIPAGKKVKFKPGGLHIMIMGLKKHPIVGESVPLTLTFSNGKEITVNAVVKKQVSEQGNLSG
ncbi:copper chaperone PCu(A)C [Parendozoicomonas haliclonae]|uniref:Copper chaperone PCu(A)C n=1 Tax=Parendozoicomonas haliclonae TaxID=1960125 RepID=A0A1X7ADL4_9GAMM|nr:copper chaperone PCu(A)C [Parendozoicomonas haliclonae]SMA32083.1 hypothetical protein EHSB41UT_00101 [Parendozoicomonas haliclonae]